MSKVLKRSTIRIVREQCFSRITSALGTHKHRCKKKLRHKGLHQCQQCPWQWA